MVKIGMQGPSKRITWSLLLLFVVLLACSLPGITPEVTVAPTEAAQVQSAAEQVIVEPTRAPPPTSTPKPLPPALVEVIPPAGTTVPLQGSFTFYFNQPMDKPSVELALSGQPPLSGMFTWLDDATVVFESDAALLPDSELNLYLSTSALAKNGQFLQDPVSLKYSAAPPLIVTQLLPEPGAAEVDPTAAIVAAFNQPVVSPEADPASLPAALTIEPEVPGQGQWVNHSTYIYTPQPALAGGSSFTVRLNPSLVSKYGSPFEGREVFELNAFEWTFETASPRLVSISPGDGATTVSLDTVFRVEFNQPMDTVSVEENFSVFDLKQTPVAGAFGWEEDLTTLTFTPTNLLSRDTQYTLALLGRSRSSSGTTLGFDAVARIRTVPAFRILSTQPGNRGIKAVQAKVSLTFSGPADKGEDPLQYINISPKIKDLSHWWGDFNRTLNLEGDFQPLTTYTVTVSEAFPDLWGARTGRPYTFTFETTALDPALAIAPGAQALAIRPQEATVSAQVTHIKQIEMALSSLPIDQLVTILAPGSHDLFQNYQAADRQTWNYKVGSPGDTIHFIQLPVTPEGQELEPGIFHLSIRASELSNQPAPFLLVSSNVQLSFKMSTTSVLVWAVDLRTMEPVPGVPVMIYNNEGVRLTSGPTDAQGIFQSPIATQPDLYNTYYAVMGEPGEEFFGLSLSNWNQGIQGMDFGIPTDFSAPGTSVTLYTDRQVYRPGQEVFYRGVVRHEHNGRYALPGFDSIPVIFYDGTNNPIQQFDLEISEFGTIQGNYPLPEDALPGSYRLVALDDSLLFQVADPRHPGIELALEAPEAVAAGKTIEVQVNTAYSLNSPAGNMPLTWRLYRKSLPFELPGYQTGPEPYRWLEPPWQMPEEALGELVDSGEARTDPDGKLILAFPTVSQEMTRQYILEASLEDGSGLRVSNRTAITVHPGDFYIGLQPETWVGQAGSEMAFQVLTVDWLNSPAGERALSARFQEVTWIRSNTPDPTRYPIFTPQYKPVSSADLVTGPDGIARLAFTPNRAGTYELEIRGAGVRTSLLVWVGGDRRAPWPNLPNNHLPVIPDQESYLPGDQAMIFIPNPFGERVQVLVTVERDEVLRYDTFSLDAGSVVYPLALRNPDTPNAYVSVTLVGQEANGRPGFRQGYLNLEVQPLEKELDITLDLDAVEPQGEPRLEPGGEANLTVKIRDFMGRPVRGEFSLAIIDTAAQSAAEEDFADFLQAFYGLQPLGVRSGMTLGVDTQRRIKVPESGGTAQEEIQFFTRSPDIPDTAFWQANVVTDDSGEATLSLALPELQTTWQVVVRGVSADTLVGELQVEWLTSTGLQVQPVVQRFLVAGDHVPFAADVYNHTTKDLLVDVSLQANGFTLDQANKSTQRIKIQSASKARVNWWGRVEEIDSLEPVFSAEGSGFQDTARPETVPVVRFNSPHSFSSAGILDLEREALEVISLPRTYNPQSGKLDLILAPSLAAVMTDGLNFLERCPAASSEQILGSFLPNLMAYRTIQDFGLETPGLATRLERTLEVGIQRLAATQNEDGGWSWWVPVEGLSTEAQPSTRSDSFLSTYLLFGLSKAQQAGVFVDDAMIQQGRNYLLATLPDLQMLSSTWQLDRLAFHYLALSETGEGVTGMAKDFFDVRDQLSPYAEAFLALTLGNDDPGDSRIDTLLTDLEEAAIQGETGLYWQGKNYPANLDTPAFNTAVVVYTLAKYDPASLLIPEALGTFMPHRKADGSWGSSYETTWILLALIEVMKGTGELAGDFAFSANLNGEAIIEGLAGGDTRLNSISTSIPVSELYDQAANGLSLQRSTGPGRLYYAAYLNLNQPAAEAEAQSRGIHVARSYIVENDDKLGEVGDRVTVRLALTLENDTHYLVVEDFLPAGAKILETTRAGEAGCRTRNDNCYLPKAPFANGWGWWWFHEPQVFEDHITWAVDFLPAGTYELTYSLVLLHPGEYQVLPARAWQMYLPEVNGSSAGEIFKIEP